MKSSLGFGHFAVTEFAVKDEFNYAYDYVVGGNTYTSNLKISSIQNTILNLKIDSEYPYSFDNYFILQNYARLKYIVGDTEYVSSALSDKTPGTYKEGLYLAVDKNIINASKIWLEINIRNSQYIYTLK